jgi:hypothetical protein
VSRCARPAEGLKSRETARRATLAPCRAEPNPPNPLSLRA